MTELEYKTKMGVARKEFEAKMNQIHIEYADANNPHKVGDIIKDHIGFGKIERIKYYISQGKASCIYVCENLTTTLKPKKREPIREIYQINVKMINHAKKANIR